MIGDKVYASKERFNGEIIISYRQIVFFCILMKFHYSMADIELFRIQLPFNCLYHHFVSDNVPGITSLNSFYNPCVLCLPE